MEAQQRVFTLTENPAAWSFASCHYSSLDRPVRAETANRPAGRLRRRPPVGPKGAAHRSKQRADSAPRESVFAGKCFEI